MSAVNPSAQGRSRTPARSWTAPSWWRFIRPEYLLTWPVFTVTLLWAIFLNLLDNNNNPTGHVIERAVIVLVVQVLLFAILGLGVVLLRWVPSRLIPVGLLITIVVATSSRGAALGLLMEAEGYVAESGLGFRITASLVNIGLALLLATAIVGEIRTYHQTTSRLLAEQARLGQLKAAALERVRQVDESLVASIQDELRRMIQPITGTDTDAALLVLRATIDEVVRPLSHRLERQGRTWAPPTDVPRERRIDWRRTLSDAADPARIRPVPIAIAACFISLPAMLLNYGARQSAVLVAFVFVAGSLALTGSRWVGIRLVRRLPPAWKAIVFLGCLYLASQLIGLGTVALMMSGSENPTFFVRLAPIFVVGIGALIALASSARSQAGQVEQELVTVDQELRWAVARAREVERQRERTLAHVLHGKVQATLSASYLRIRLEAGAGTDSAGLLDEVRAEIESAIDLLATEAMHPRDLDDVMRRLQSTWTGIAEIRFAAEAGLDEALKSDPVCLTVLNDLIPELCFNAIKHCDAAHISVNVGHGSVGHGSGESGTGRTLVLEVANDGVPMNHDARPGLGTRLLDDSTLWWTRHPEGDRLVTRACLPLDPTSAPVVVAGAPRSPIDRPMDSPMGRAER